MTGIHDSSTQIPDRADTPAGSAARRGQSLADGALSGILLHVERALAAEHGWDQVRDRLDAALAGGVRATDEAGLYRGAPAVAFVLHTAATDEPHRFARARLALDRAVTALTHRRVDLAMDRIRRGEPASTAEYDVINGLTGIGAHLLAHHPGGDALGRTLDYLVTLTRPVRRDGREWPGWWVAHGPDGTLSAQFPGGHANLGLAHGVSGSLALLALAARHGITVEGHRDAIDRICICLDMHRRDEDGGRSWPQWITADEHRRGRSGQLGPGRPSWCYGTPGIARALQLAGIATGDAARRGQAEHALVTCLVRKELATRISDATVCHGWAGLALTTWRAAADAQACTDPSADNTSPLFAHLPRVIEQLRRHAATARRDPADGLLEGHTGVELVLDTIGRAPSSATGWDRCLLIA